MTPADERLKERVLAVLRHTLGERMMYYDRKEDEDVPIGAIEKAVKKGLIKTADVMEIAKSCMGLTE